MKNKFSKKEKQALVHQQPSQERHEGITSTQPSMHFPSQRGDWTPPKQTRGEPPSKTKQQLEAQYNPRKASQKNATAWWCYCKQGICNLEIINCCLFVIKQKQSVPILLHT